MKDVEKQLTGNLIGARISLTLNEMSESKINEKSLETGKITDYLSMLTGLTLNH